jgi:PKD repeat protein
MKTTKNKIVVLILFLLAHLSIYAQYSGGDSDGAVSEQLNVTSCSTPLHFYAYFGGNGDAAGLETISTTTCGLSNNFYAYFGGSGDGGSTEELSQTSCGAPAHFYAYFGGTNDGAGSETISATVCAFPPQFYAYFGGDGDGYSLDTTAPICPTLPPIADFAASQTTICVGQSVTFTDASTNIPFVWSWTFAGGTPTSATAQNPTVQYNTAGTYAVTLTATNYNGSDTKTITGYITVTAIPTVATTTPGSRCDAGSVTLGATSSIGTLKWYSAATGGTVLGTGTSFATPSITTTTTYYVEASSGSCASVRTAVIATVNTTPSITATTPASRCGTGIVSLSATSSAGSTVWYATATGGTALATTNTFSTPSISATTTYYVEATTGSCTSPRTAVIATVNTIPTITSTTPGSRCDSGTVTLGATASAGTINWYNVPTGGTIIGTGTSFTTPSISTATTYYVEATTGSCTSTRTAVVATATPSPTITSSTPGSRCDSGVVTLSATTTSGSSTVWYSSASGGTALATTNTFVTPSISTTTTYYVEAVNGSCVSPRTAVVATVNTTPTVTATVPNSRCGGGLITLSATASAGTLNWYNAATGGTFIASGTSISPTVSGTTTFYVEATSGSCTSPRTAVIATVNTIPTVTATTPNSRCDAGSLTLGATASAGTLSWYSVASGGVVLGTGTSFTTPSITTTTTYYVETSNGSCTSPRTAVVASINAIAAPTGSSNQTFCAGETVGLLLVNGSNVLWYATPTGGTAISNTAPLVSGSTYYASQTVTTCESAVRLAVNVTIGTCLGTEEFSSNELKWYPNPVTDILNISNTDLITKIEVHNMLGQLVQSQLLNAKTTQIDMTSFALGTYLVKVSVADKVKTFKVIKK